MMLAPITDGALKIIRSHEPIVELFAGSGDWLRAMWKAGIEAVAFDDQPGPDVLYGGIDSIKQWSTHTLLMIWPPDIGVEFQCAMKIFCGKSAISIGDHMRFVDQQPSRWRTILSLYLPDGTKGPNELRVWERILP